MRLQKGQRWQCESHYCGSEIQVLASSEVECGINPRCSCGSMMKKIPVAPRVKSCAPAEPVPDAEQKAGSNAK
jgi:hypothetical protein